MGVSMHVFHDPVELKKHLSVQIADAKSIGFVPTMGALHSGHLALVEGAARDNDTVVVSIFVNPTQFNKSKDLNHYPRQPEKDIQKLKEHSFCTVVFLPSVEHIYPDGEMTDSIDLGGVDVGMEGSFRRGHFEGVATVVKRFFTMIRPTRAYFGEKDFQQLAVVRRMVKAVGLPVEIIGHQTERSDSGLALSSRNLLLNDTDLSSGLLIIHSLEWMRDNFKKFTPNELKQKVKQDFSNSPLLLEYVEIADPVFLKPIEDWGVTKHARGFIAAQVSGVRLIDNLSLF